MNYKFVINDFEGPLDLLLHLIKDAKMDIYNIKIEQITSQYIGFIKGMKDLNIVIASEYLVMAGELLRLKSKMLLNQDDNEDEEENIGINSVEDLQNKIIEYEKYKKMGSTFKDLEQKRSEIFTKLPSELNAFIDDSIVINQDVTVNDLLNAFSLFLERQKLQKPLNTRIVKKEYNVEERSRKIIELLNIRKKVEFTELFDIMTKEYVVVTFLSILELTKSEKVTLKQDNNFDSIIIEKK